MRRSCRRGSRHRHSQAPNTIPGRPGRSGFRGITTGARAELCCTGRDRSPRGWRAPFRCPIVGPLVHCVDGVGALRPSAPDHDHGGGRVQRRTGLAHNATSDNRAAATRGGRTGMHAVSVPACTGRTNRMRDGSGLRRLHGSTRSTRSRPAADTGLHCPARNTRRRHAVWSCPTQVNSEPAGHAAAGFSCTARARTTARRPPRHGTTRRTSPHASCPSVPASGPRTSRAPASPAPRPTRRQSASVTFRIANADNTTTTVSTVTPTLRRRRCRRSSCAAFSARCCSTRAATFFCSSSIRSRSLRCRSRSRCCCAFSCARPRAR